MHVPFNVRFKPIYHGSRPCTFSTTPRTRNNIAMSMRPRGAAAAAAAVSRRTRAGVRPVYEDFKPMSEWSHEDGVDILLYHLPGFVKEQIRIIAESRGILKVHGERLVAGNKWSRFQEEIVVPEHCNMTEIRAKFEGGVLRIIMPRLVVAANNNNKKHESSQEITDTTHESSTFGATTGTKMQQKPQQLKEDATPTNNTTTTTTKEQPKKLYDRLVSPTSRHVDNDAKESNNREDRMLEHARDDNMGKTQATSLNKVDSNEVGRFKGVSTTLNKQNDHILEEKEKKKKNGDCRFSNDHKVMGHLVNENKQLVMNMGAAILVIMALGACISYSFGLSE